MRCLPGLCMRPFSAWHPVPHGDVEPLQGSLTRGPFTEGALPAGCGSTWSGFWLTADGFGCGYAAMGCSRLRCN